MITGGELTQLISSKLSRESFYLSVQSGNFRSNVLFFGVYLWKPNFFSFTMYCFLSENVKVNQLRGSSVSPFLPGV